MTTTSARLANAYVKAGGKTVGAIPWELIITWLKSILGGCTSAEIRKTAKEHPVLMAGWFRTRLRRESSAISAKNRDLISDVAVQELAKMSAIAIDAMRNEDNL